MRDSLSLEMATALDVGDLGLLVAGDGHHGDLEELDLLDAAVRPLVALVLDPSGLLREEADRHLVHEAALEQAVCLLALIRVEVELELDVQALIVLAGGKGLADAVEREIVARPQ